MRTLVAALILAASMTTAHASCVVPGESDLNNHECYRNREDKDTHRPAGSRVIPSTATARCSDGDFSFSRHHSGTCSRHGGVARWFR